MFPVSRTTQPHPNSSQARSRDEAPRSSVPGPRPEWAGTHTVQSSWPQAHWYTIYKYPFDCKITNTCHSWQGNPGFHLGSHWRARSDTCVSSPPQQWAPESYSRKGDGGGRPSSVMSLGVTSVGGHSHGHPASPIGVGSSWEDIDPRSPEPLVVRGGWLWLIWVVRWTT